MENQLMNTSDDGAFTLNLKNAVQCYSSLNPKTVEEKIAFFNAVNSPSKRLKEMVNLELSLKDIYAEQCEFIDKEDGVAQPGIRIVFIDADGVSYQAASKGIFTSTQKLLAIMGEPKTWKQPVKIRIKEISKGKENNVLIFELVA